MLQLKGDEGAGRSAELPITEVSVGSSVHELWGLVGAGLAVLEALSSSEIHVPQSMCDMHTYELEIRPLTRPRSVRVVNMTMSDNF